MKPFEFSRKALKQPTLALGAVTVITLCLIWFSEQFKETHLGHLNQARSSLNVIRNEYRLASQAGDIINTSAHRYKQLQRRGFIGEEPRLIWIEALRSSGIKHNVYTLEYRLKQQQILSLESMGQSQYYQLYASLLHLHLDLAHEVDLIHFFATLEEEQAAIYRLSGCTLSPTFGLNGVSVSKPNVSADCDLIMYTAKQAEVEEEDPL